MKYGRIAGNSRINTAIHRCFEYVTEEDVRKFVKKFSELPHDGPQVMHTFRELVLGAFLRREGLDARYDWKTDDETPDWSVVNGGVQGMIELVNFHLDRPTEGEIRTTIGQGRVWVGWPGENTARLYDRLWAKTVLYTAIRERLRIPYVVAVFGLFDAFVTIEEVRECVNGADHGLFALYPSLSGVMFFDESSARYDFQYLPNRNAELPWVLPSAVFDLSENSTQATVKPF